MTPPPPYPRTPYLWAPPARVGDDRVVPANEVASWLHRLVLVEEKLDGANVSLWLENGRIEVASRGGPGAMDRGGQLGRLRAWAAERDEPLRGALDGGWVIYGEWLWLTHGTRYDLLPDWLAVLDYWHVAAGFAPADDRHRRAAQAGLAAPPRLFDGILGSEGALSALLGPSRWSSSGRAEGLVLRTKDGRRCKVVDPGYRLRTDAEWDDRQHNMLAAPMSKGSR